MESCSEEVAPICCACWDELELQPPRKLPRPGEPLKVYPEQECDLCGAVTWAGLYLPVTKVK